VCYNPCQMADTDDALAEQAVQAPVPAEQPTERPAVGVQETVPEPTVMAQPTVSRGCSVGGAHVPWRPGQWGFIVVRQAGLRVAVEICLRCGIVYVDQVIEDGS